MSLWGSVFFDHRNNLNHVWPIRGGSQRAVWRVEDYAGLGIVWQLPGTAAAAESGSRRLASCRLTFQDSRKMWPRLKGAETCHTSRGGKQ